MRLSLVFIACTASIAEAGVGFFAADSSWETVSAGHRVVEGIAWSKGVLYLTDVPDRELFRIADGREPELMDKDTGAANGLAFGPDGKLYGACMRRPAIVVWDRASGERTEIGLPTPANDLAISKQGVVYYTWGEANAVYRFSLADPKPEKAAGLPNPNGITLSHNGRELLVGEFFGDTVRSFSILSDGSLGPPRAAFRAKVPENGYGLLDGMTSLEDGRLLVATALGLQILAENRDAVLTWVSPWISRLTAPGPTPICQFMARQPRFEYPGAVYHVMARGDGGKQIFVGRDDHESFLYWLERVCTSHGWRVHAWVLMGNHFHLLLKTPEANLVSGMRMLLGTFGKAWNIRRQRQGHVFQGRYKAVPVAGEGTADAHYFKCVADYIHLNPARAGLAGGIHGKLVDYPWSSLSHYGRVAPPAWQPVDRVLEAFKLSKDRRGRKSYLSWLEARASEHGGAINEEAMQAMRQGWYLGEERFKDKLLGLLDKTAEKLRGKNSHAGAAVRAHHQGEAERILSILALELGLPQSREELIHLKKNDPRKVVCASLVKRRTTVSNDWIAERLAMGHPASMSQHVNRMRKEPKAAKQLKKHEDTLKSKD